MSYRINDLKEAFEIYVLQSECEFHLNDEIKVYQESRKFEWLLDQLEQCSHKLSNGLCDYLELKTGASYAQAVKLIRDKISF